MKHHLIALAFLGGIAHSADLPTSGQLTIPYSEFEQLLEKTRKAPEKCPPVSQATLSTHVSLDVKDQQAMATIRWKVVNMAAEAALVPLIADGVTVMKVDPANEVLVRKDGFYQILVAPTKTLEVELQIGFEGKREYRSTIFQCQLASSAMVSVALAELPEGQKVDIPGAHQNPSTGEYHLAGGVFELQVTDLQEVDQPTPEVVSMPAVITEATARMRLVSDGMFLNSTTWNIRHTEAMVWSVAPGPDTQLVSASVGGQPAAPVLGADGRFEFQLPENTSATRVELTYTGKTSAFGPVRGDLSVSLPATDLLIERSDWQLLLPSGYVAVAVEGNTEFLPADYPNEIKLRKELSRDEAPAVRIYYQKPETNKNL